MITRPPAVAGQFYPEDPVILKKQINEYLAEAEPAQIPGSIKAIISPHAGYIYSGPVAGYSYKLLQRLDKNKEWKVILLGPAHYAAFEGAAAPQHQAWRTPLGEVSVYDIREEIGGSKNITEVPNADTSEHSLEVQVPFLQITLDNFKLYPLVLGEVNYRSLAEELAEFCNQDNVLTIISSDLSHYLPYEQACETDLNTCRLITGLDIKNMRSSGGACGRHGILTALYIAKKLGWRCQLLDYRNSGDTAGAKDRVVGYGAFAFYK